VLSPEEIDRFVAEGYVAIRGAIAPEVTRACQDIIWAELASAGIRRDDPATWTRPVLRINTPGGGPFAAAGTTELVGAACDQLLGPGRWVRHAGVGGTIPVRFPSPDDPGDAGWHIEGSYREHGEQRVSLRSRGRGLLALYLFTDVGPDDAPTRLRPGSHHDVPPILAPGGDDGMPWLSAAQQAAQASANRPTAWATGRAGDVFLCHPFLVHAASWPHRGRSAKMMAQPPVLLTSGQFPWPSTRTGPPTPVELAIFPAANPVPPSHG
jgi:Phytanoyl-CoA dioxygenase (PhyH)